jgi:hypothetical protein
MPPLQTITLTGLTVGTLDLAAAAALLISRGGTFLGLLQRVASGALGEAALTGGKKSAAIGLFFHYFIAFSVTAFFFAASRQLPILLAYAFISGPVYGIGVHLFMTFVVTPMSRIPKRPFSPSFFFAQLLIHIFIIGLPIALLIRHFS